MKYRYYRVGVILLITITLLFTTTGSGFAASKSYLSALQASVHTYQRQTGSFTLAKSTRFFIVSEEKPSKELSDTVRLASREFAAKKRPSKSALPVFYGSKALSDTGDIVIRLAASGYSEQGYKIVVTKDCISITAGTSDGVFYGLRTLLKMFVSKGSNTIPCCTIKDRPDVKERTVHLDCGRKYFSKTWIKNLIKRMSWQGYNAVELHFSDDQGLRLESKKFPWLAGSYGSNKNYLSQAAMAEICETARQYHVEVIPSFDTPGHMDYIVKKYKNYIAKHPNYKFKYNGKTYSKKRSGFKNISNYLKYQGCRSDYNYKGIDLSNPTARAFASALIDEYADFFKKQGCTKFNIGGDELLGWDEVVLNGKTFNFYNKWDALQHWDRYAQNVLAIKNGSAADTFISYLNTTAKRLEKKGYTCRVWSDEIDRVNDQHISLKKSIHIVYWSNKYQPISKLKKKGYQFHNAVSLWTYYVTTDGGGYKRSNKEDIYRYWNPKSFADPFKKAKTVPASQYAGAYFCIWCDYPDRKTQKEVWSLTKGRTWSSSAKMWNRQINTEDSGSGKALSYNSFSKYTSRLGTFPGYSGSPAKVSTLPKAQPVKQAPLPQEPDVQEPETQDPETQKKEVQLN